MKIDFNEKELQLILDSVIFTDCGDVCKDTPSFETSMIAKDVILKLKEYVKKTSDDVHINEDLVHDEPFKVQYLKEWDIINFKRMVE